MEQQEKQAPELQKKRQEQAGEEATSNAITITDFAKVELCVGEILSCEVIESSDKLYRFTVDFGETESRQILAGVRKYFEPEELVGKQGVFVINLPPRSMLGLESQAMMLCARDEDGKFAMATVSGPVSNGTRLS